MLEYHLLLPLFSSVEISSWKILWTRFISRLHPCMRKWDLKTKRRTDKFNRLKDWWAETKKPILVPQSLTWRNTKYKRQTWSAGPRKKLQSLSSRQKKRMRISSSKNTSTTYTASTLTRMTSQERQSNKEKLLTKSSSTCTSHCIMSHWMKNMMRPGTLRLNSMRTCLRKWNTIDKAPVGKYHR